VLGTDGHQQDDELETGFSTPGADLLFADLYAEHGGIGQLIAFGNRAPGQARTMAEMLVEEPITQGRSDNGAVGAPGAEARGPGRVKSCC